MHVFDALADPVRRTVLERLAEGEANSGELVEAVQTRYKISQAAVSQHLKVLRDTGLAVARPEGTRRIYRLDCSAFLELDAWLARIRPQFQAEPTMREGKAPPTPKRRLDLGPMPDKAELQSMLVEAEGQVSWAEQRWDTVADIAADRSAENAPLAARLLCRLAKSLRDGRPVRDLALVATHLADERAAVSRSVLEEFWKVGLVSADLRTAVVDHLHRRFRHGQTGKTSLQTRLDIIDALAKLHRATGDPAVSQVISTIVSTGQQRTADEE
ncbi:MAG: winged helix-turn-helix transcriptional regulator [Armatimonadetes bacterium]|nr:winged helix-turn-helix transcriptional regulator [Armatimonadota bacterium]